ncbi:MAG: protease Lon-related BREX system protein BrxL [Peptococcaceae bacterium]|jgi:ATP-dependent Lon protease|nr:protease Lon-related BREX system protein BrxL [Peptococcaceae bacterium]
MSQLDRKVNDVFGGKVVRKNLVRQVKVGANVPVYVLEYLLGKYCASEDGIVIQAGLVLVNSVLAENFVRPDEANKAQFRLKDQGRASFIDKVRVRVLEDKDWAELANFGHRYVNVPDYLIRQYPRILEGGIWAQVELEYRPEEEGERSFYITDIRPIQLASFEFREYVNSRPSFTTDEWIDLLVRSVGLEPSFFSRRLKLFVLSRLIPMVERNYNFVELGPRSTGKSFVYRDLSPYSILVSGGRTTVANLFYNMATGKMGLVGLWDVVAFDEVAGINFSDKTAVQILKDYMEAGSFSRGKEELVADASMVFVGNINVPVEILVKTKHLFQPLPEPMQDMALIDRVHFYLPGWEVPKLVPEHFTDHYGFVVDYLAEAFRELRKQNFTDVLDRHFSLGAHLNARDAKAVRKTVSGLVKLLHPDRGVTKEELTEYVELALEGRRRVKEQLKKMGSFEFYQTSFSFIDNDTREERVVGVPEEGGRDLISQDPLPPGCVYAVTSAVGNTVALYRLEITKVGGSGKLKIAGSPPKALRDSMTTAFNYVLSRKTEMGLESDLGHYDFHVQVVGLIAGREGGEVGLAFLAALYSLVRGRSVLSALAVVGQMTIQGHVVPVASLTEILQLAMDNGARRVLIPVENKRHFLEVPADILEKVDPIFYSDPLVAAIKALGMN